MNTKAKGDYWSRVWCRVVYSRVASPTFEATLLVPPEHNRCFNVEYLKQCMASEDKAFDVFLHDFTQLIPRLQLMISGALTQTWYDRDRAERGIT